MQCGSSFSLQWDNLTIIMGYNSTGQQIDIFLVFLYILSRNVFVMSMQGTNSVINLQKKKKKKKMLCIIPN